MATWDTSQYDDILNVARRMAENEYTRQRQAVLDKRAAQDYALKRKDDLRKAELAKVNHDYTMRNVSDIQKLADMKRQNELNILEAAQQKHDINTALHNDRMLHLGDELELARLKRQRDINTHKIDAKKQGYTLQNFDRTAADAERARQDKEDQIAYSRRTYSPYQEAVLTLKASGGNVNALTDAEKSAIDQQAEKEYQLYSTLVPFTTKAFAAKSVQNFLEERRADAAKNQFYDKLISSTPEQLEAKTGVNPAFIPLYAKQQRDAAAENAKYARQNAAKIAQAQQKEVYNNVSAKIASYYNEAANREEIDRKETKPEETIKYATQIYINALKSGGQITYKQAVEQAAGLNTGTTSTQLSPSEYAKYADIYGVDFIKLPKEVTANIKLAEDRAKNAALKEGVLTIGEDGKVNFSGSLEDLQRIADEEEEIYKALELKTLSPKGYFRTILNKMLAEKQANEAAAAKAKADKSAEDATNELKRKGKSFWELMATGAYADQANAAHWASAQLGRENKSAIDDYTKQDRKLKRRGN